MKRNGLKIGLALSGGGMRAVIFHLGVLKYLAEKKLLESIEYISSVSGGSICVALMYTNNNMRWVTSEEYLTRVLPSIRRLILNEDIERRLIIRSIIDIPHIFDTKCKKLANTMRIFWRMDGKLGELPKRPKWDINAVTYETGKRFFFSQERCGDRNIGYFYGDELNISEAVAASAGFPILIGMYELKRDRFEWFDRCGEKRIEPSRGKLHLWDGGVYDNLGLEPIFQRILRDEKEINYYIVSDAGAGSEEFVPYRKIFGRARALKRLLDISMEQVDSLNSRFYKEYIEREKNGVYIRIGESAKDILKDVKMEEWRRLKRVKSSLSAKECKWAENYPTNLRKPEEEEFDRLLQHGYECMLLKNL